MKDRVRRQFAATAAAYVNSEGHARGDDLAILVRLARPAASDRALDIATGGGHAALALAPLVSEVVATDLTVEMLEAARAFISEQGARNVRFEVADAEQLPFPDAAFDIVTSRIAPHHFPQPELFVQEAARVLRPGGRFVLDDNMVPEDLELDGFMNRFEAWRDPSHVRAHRLSEWTRWIEASGLRVLDTAPLAHKRYPYQQWTQRSQTPPAAVRELEEWILAAPARLRDHFRVEVDEATGRLVAICGMWSVIAAEKP